MTPITGKTTASHSCFKTSRASSSLAEMTCSSTEVCLFLFFFGFVSLFLGTLHLQGGQGRSHNRGIHQPPCTHLGNMGATTEKTTLWASRSCSESQYLTPILKGHKGTGPEAFYLPCEEKVGHGAGGAALAQTCEFLRPCSHDMSFFLVGSQAIHAQP